MTEIITFRGKPEMRESAAEFRDSTYIIAGKMTEFENKVAEALRINGLGEFNTPEILAGLAAFCDILVEKNKVMNLTAITDGDGIAVRHFADSLTVAKHLPENASVIDVGCGAGFPSLPLAIARPDLKITALDATAKRIAFVNGTAAALGLKNITGISGRAEELAAAGSELREKFDFSVSRAVARQAVLAELCLPFTAVGGRFIAMKADAAEEVAEAKRGTAILGGGEIICEEFMLLGESEPQTRTFALTDKIKKTPDIYPRDFSRIKKKPL